MHPKFSGLKSMLFIVSWFFGWGFWAELGQAILLFYAVLAGVSLSAVFSGIWVGQENPERLCSCVLYYHAFPCGLFFFFIYVAKVGFFMVISAYSDFLYGISFSKDNVTTSEGTHYRPKAQLQKLYSHFCCILLTKTAYEPGKTAAKEKFHIWWEHM